MTGEGESLLSSLKTVDAAQEAKRLHELPNKVAEYYVLKGTLYAAIKMINDAGRAFFADNPQQASRFNLGILYRRRSPRTQQPAPQPNP